MLRSRASKLLRTRRVALRVCPDVGTRLQPDGRIAVEARASRLRLATADHPPEGWTWVTVATEPDDPPLHMHLAPEGADPIPLPGLGGGRYRRLVHLPAGRPLHLLPHDRPGPTPRFRHVEAVETTWPAVLAHAMRARPGEARAALGLALRRGPKAGLGRLMTALAAPEQAVDYARWIVEFDTLTAEDEAQIRTWIAGFRRRPRFSVLVPVYASNPAHLEAAIASVETQLYPDWELILVDDASPSDAPRRILRAAEARDPRIRALYRPVNGNISAASNDGLAAATGDYLALLDHDDLLAPHALAVMAGAMQGEPEPDILYSDEDALDSQGRRRQPHFKPIFNEELFYGQNLINHLGVYRMSLARAAGGFREGYEGSQDHDLALRCLARVGSKAIRHVPHVLYHWRIGDGAATYSTRKRAATAASARRALADHFDACGIRARIEPGPADYHRIVRERPDPAPKVSILIPTRDRVDLLRMAVSGALSKTAYPDLEVIVIDNGSVEAKSRAYFREILEDDRVRVLDAPGPFNFSALNNRAAAAASGDLVLLLNNDIEMVEPHWLDALVAQAMRPEVGAVGAKLLYPDRRIQHAGVVMGLGGIGSHAFCGLKNGDDSYFRRADLAQEIGAVTGACLLTRKAVYDRLGGLDADHLKVAFNDIDYCLKVRKAGLNVIYEPRALLIHHESASRGLDMMDAEKAARLDREAAVMKARWGSWVEEDPYYSPNMARAGLIFRPAFPPRVDKPWRRGA